MLSCNFCLIDREADAFLNQEYNKMYLKPSTEGLFFSLFLSLFSAKLVAGAGRLCKGKKNRDQVEFSS